MILDPKNAEVRIVRWAYSLIIGEIERVIGNPVSEKCSPGDEV